MMSEFRSWEDLELNPLLNILKRVGLGPLLLDVPFVCKSWFKASLIPSCWEHLDFKQFCEDTSSPLVRRFIDENQVRKFSVGGLVRLIVARGVGKTASLALPKGCNNEDLEDIAHKCPELKSLSLKSDVVHNDSAVLNLMESWKLLEELTIELNYERAFLKTVAEIGRNCKNFRSLAICHSHMTELDAISIASHLPKIKILSLLDCVLQKMSFQIIVKSCKNLEVLDVKKCKLVVTCNEFELLNVDEHMDAMEKLTDAMEKNIKHFVSHIKTVKLDFSYEYDVESMLDDYDDFGRSFF